MGFIRQRDIIQQKRLLKELESKCKACNSLANREAVSEAEELLEDMKEEYKKYEEIFSEMR
jgi:hypothetical protein